jgi:hypothetical protein
VPKLDSFLKNLEWLGFVTSLGHKAYKGIESKGLASDKKRRENSVLRYKRLFFPDQGLLVLPEFQAIRRAQTLSRRQ